MNPVYTQFRKSIEAEIDSLKRNLELEQMRFKDNDVGRKAILCHKLTDHKSFGTKITEERLSAFRQKYGDDFRVEIIDKEENGDAKGTIVVLRIPVVDSSDMDGIID